MNSQNEKPSSVQVDPAGWVVLRRVKEKIGVGKNELVTRLLTWFDAQPRAVQIELLDTDGDPVGELVKIRLAEMAAAGDEAVNPGKLQIEDCLRVIERMTKRIEQIEAGRKEQLASGAKAGAKTSQKK